MARALSVVVLVGAPVAWQAPARAATLVEAGCGYPFDSGLSTNAGVVGAAAADPPSSSPAAATPSTTAVPCWSSSTLPANLATSTTTPTTVATATQAAGGQATTTSASTSTTTIAVATAAGSGTSPVTTAAPAPLVATKAATGLAFTGADIWQSVLLAGVLILGGSGIVAVGRHRRAGRSG
jgi:hypothetical protein